MQNHFRKNGNFPQYRQIFRSLVVCISFLGLAGTISAQQTLDPTISEGGTTSEDEAVSESELPDSPGWQSLAAQSSNPQSTASISGYVFDINGGLVPSAKITLQSQSGMPDRVETVDDTGFFILKTCRPEASKSESRRPTSNLRVLRDHHPRQRKPPTQSSLFPSLQPPSTFRSPSPKSRSPKNRSPPRSNSASLVSFPNFYTSFLWNAAPLKPKQKFRLAIRSATDPVTFFTTGFLAGIQQARDTYPVYGQGAEGYAKRYGADYTDLFVGRMLGGAVFPSLFRQDPRYFYQGTGTITSRAWHALSSAFICRGDNGRRQFNYSHILGNLHPEISNLYRPEKIAASLSLDNALLHTAANAAWQLSRFV